MDEERFKAIVLGTLAIVAVGGTVHTIVSYFTSKERRLIEIAQAAVHRLKRIHTTCMEDTFYSMADTDIKMSIIKPYYDSMVLAWKTQLTAHEVETLEAYVFSNLKALLKIEE